jgi:tRNA (cytidine32/uridine32-2'-O)-methyltransferase
VQIPVRIVLVETSHPGNIGASARAMKTMGVTELALVRPKSFPSAEATALASGADDLLTRALICATLADAIADCSLVVGASARARSVGWSMLTPRECGRAIRTHTPAANSADGATRVRAAVVMGPEQSGLTNEDLARCGALVQIPANPEYGSLNLAMAVQLLCYELRMAWLEGEAGMTSSPEERENSTHPRSTPATAGELEGLHEHMERVLEDAGFLHPDHPHQLKLKLRRLFHRAGLDRDEVNILRGMLAALDPRRRAGRR